METIIIKAEGASLSKVKTFLEETHIPFKIKKTKKKQDYDPEFVKMILERGESARNGNTITVNPDDIWGSLGLM